MAKRRRIRRQRKSRVFNIQVDKTLVDYKLPANDGLLDDPNSTEFFDKMAAAGVVPLPDKFLIPESDWDDWIIENEKAADALKEQHGGDLMSPLEYYSTRFTHQGSSHECVCHAAQQVFMSCYNRQVGIKNGLWFSPVALYTRLTGGRQWGGSNVRHSLTEMMQTGMLLDHDGPAGDNAQFNKYKCTVHQTSGRSESHWPTKGWIRPSELPQGWPNVAEHFRVLEAYTIPSARAHGSAILRQWSALNNGRQGHSIPHFTMVKDSNGRHLSRYKDSYNVWRYDSKGLWGGGYVVRAVTMFDDPANPKEILK